MTSRARSLRLTLAGAIITSTLAVIAAWPASADAQVADRARRTDIPVTRRELTGGEAAELRRHYFLADFAGGADLGSRLPANAPAEARAWYLINLARSGRNEEAVAQAQRMRDADPSSPWGWFALATTANYTQDHGDTALVASEELIRRAPRHPDAIWLRAQVLSSQGNDSASIAFLDSIARQTPLTAHQLVVKANAVYGTAYERGRFNPERAEAAFALYAEARGLDSLDLTAHFLAANRLLSARRRDEAMPLLERAVALSPYSLSVRRDYWRGILADPALTTAEKQALILPQSDSLLAARGTHASILSGVSYIFEQLDLPDRKRELEERILAEHPATTEADWVYVNRYRAIERELRDTTVADTSDFPAKRAEYRRLLRAFAVREETRRPTLRGDAYRSLFYLLREDSTATPEELLEVVNGMVKYEGINPHTVFGRGAILLAERTTHYREAERIARMGLDSGKARIDEQKDSYETIGDYARALDWMQAFMYDAIGWVYFHEGRLEEAEKQLLHAAELSPKNRDVSHHLGRLYEARGDLEQAEEHYIRGVMTEGMGENPSEEALKVLYERRHGSLEGFEAYHANLAEIDRERRREEVLAARDSAPDPVPAFTLRTLDGTPVSSDSLAGRIVVVNHWGVWCGPCVAEMPEFAKLAQRYAEDPEVLVLTINNDTDPNVVREWMAKRGYRFPVLLDDGYARSASVTSYPTTWFIDRQGRIAFTKQGWSEELEEEFAWRVEILRTP